MEGSHSGLNISGNIKDMLKNWEIYLNRVHLIVLGNAHNMRLGMLLFNIKSIPCFFHTVQLIMKDSLVADNSTKNRWPLQPFFLRFRKTKFNLGGFRFRNNK